MREPALKLHSARTSYVINRLYTATRRAPGWCQARTGSDAQKQRHLPEAMSFAQRALTIRLQSRGVMEEISANHRNYRFKTWEISSLSGILDLRAVHCMAPSKIWSADTNHTLCPWRFAFGHTGNTRHRSVQNCGLLHFRLDSRPENTKERKEDQE